MLLPMQRRLCRPLLLIAWVVPSLLLLVLLLLLLVCVPPASLGAVPSLPAYYAPFHSCWKLCMLPLAFVGWRLGSVSFTFSFVKLAFFLFLSVCLCLLVQADDT